MPTSVPIVTEASDQMITEAGETMMTEGVSGSAGGFAAAISAALAAMMLRIKRKKSAARS